MVNVTFILLLMLMLIVMYRAGKVMRRKFKILSGAGLAIVIAYTLNEGLRYGRGVDFNIYGNAYLELEKGWDARWDVGFKSIAQVLISLGVPYQGFVMLMSFFFIIATLCLFRNYRDILPYALPLFILFSRGDVENMVRWYTAFSFIMIGLGYLIREENASKLRFWLFSAIAPFFHLAILPIPFAFYIIYYFKRPLLPPIIVLPLFLGVGYLFNTDSMQSYVELFNTLSSVSENFEGYADNAEYWLTGGFSGFTQSAFPSKQAILLLFLIVYLGHRVARNGSRNYIYAYNLFIIGLLFYPISRQIELIVRYNAPFMFFRAIVLAGVIKYIFIGKKYRLIPAVYMLSLLILLNEARHIVIDPLRGKSFKYMYVWNNGGKKYQKVLDLWVNSKKDADSKIDKKTE